jgi:hypothetical protein
MNQIHTVTQVAHQLLRGDSSIRDLTAAVQRVHYLLRTFPQQLQWTELYGKKNRGKVFTTEEMQQLIEWNHTLRGMVCHASKRAYRLPLGV